MVSVDSKLAISRWKREDRFLFLAYYYVLIPFPALNNPLEEIPSSYEVWNQRTNIAVSHWLTGRRHIGSPGCLERWRQDTGFSAGEGKENGILKKINETLETIIKRESPF